MNLQEPVMEIITTDWITSRELAKIIAEKYPEDFEGQPYSGDVTALSMALGPVLYALSNRGRIEHDGTEWPAIKRWRRVQPKEPISVDDVAEALILLHWAKDKEQAIRMLAARTIRDNKIEFEEMMKEASRIREESTKIGRKVLGLSE